MDRDYQDILSAQDGSFVFGKKSINVDDKYLSIAEQFLYRELAVALAIP